MLAPDHQGVCTCLKLKHTFISTLALTLYCSSVQIKFKASALRNPYTSTCVFVFSIISAWEQWAFDTTHSKEMSARSMRSRIYIHVCTGEYRPQPFSFTTQHLWVRWFNSASFRLSWTPHPRTHANVQLSSVWAWGNTQLATCWRHRNLIDTFRRPWMMKQQKGRASKGIHPHMFPHLCSFTFHNIPYSDFYLVTQSPFFPSWKSARFWFPAFQLYIWETVSSSKPSAFPRWHADTAHSSFCRFKPSWKGISEVNLCMVQLLCRESLTDKQAKSVPKP